MAAPILSFGQRQQAMIGLPFYGKAEFNFVASKSPFSNGIAIKILPLADLSRPAKVEVDEFKNQVDAMNRHFKKGSRISGIKVNSQFIGDKEPEMVIGKFESLKIDNENKVIRAFIRDPQSLKLIEVYPQSLNRLTESKSNYAKTFLEFLV